MDEKFKFSAQDRLVLWHIIWSRIELSDKKLPFLNIQDLIIKIDSANKPTKLCIKT